MGEATAGSNDIEVIVHQDQNGSKARPVSSDRVLRTDYSLGRRPAPLRGWAGMPMTTMIVVIGALLLAYRAHHPVPLGRGDSDFVNYFFPSWFIEFRSMSDIETLGNILYLGYPLA